VQNVVQFFPFIGSLFKHIKQDEELRRNLSAKEGEEKYIYGERAKLVNQPLSSSASQSQSPSEVPLLPRYISSLPLCAASGFFLGVHFSMWVYSMKYTSLTHSLLWVSMGPIVINGSNWFLHMIQVMRYNTTMVTSFCLCTTGALSRIHAKKPSTLETLGAVFGIVGAMIMLFDVREDNNAKGDPLSQEQQRSGSGSDPNSNSETHLHPPTIYGDAVAFSGAVAVCVYLVIGRKVRSFLPIWLYVFPVIGFACLTCLFFFVCDYYASPNGNVDRDICTMRTILLGFMDRGILPYVIYLGIGPGIFGHTMVNALLKYVSPLVVSTAWLAEPILGSLFGFMVGLQPLPGLYTWLGGGALMVGLVLVVRGENSNDNNDNGDEAIDDA